MLYIKNTSQLIQTKINSATSQKPKKEQQTLQPEISNSFLQKSTHATPITPKGLRNEEDFATRKSQQNWTLSNQEGKKAGTLNTSTLYQDSLV